MNPQPIILFDGICNLCNAAVNFVIRHDPRAHFKFASLQSEKGRQLLQEYGLQQNDFASFVLIEDNTPYMKSTAALKVATKLNGSWRFAGGFIFVPRFIRDSIYTFIAKNRYKFFGKRTTCMVPSAEISERFLK